MASYVVLYCIVLHSYTYNSTYIVFCIVTCDLEKTDSFHKHESLDTSGSYSAVCCSI